MIKFYLFLLLIFQINIHSYDVYAVVETPQMPVNGDADDPAIWINDLDKSNSLIFGTDKYNGIYSYDLNGKIINYSKAGNVNNIDIRKTHINGNLYSLLYGSNRSDSSLSLWILDDAKVDKDLKLGNFILPVKPNHVAEANMIVYGVCAGIHPEFGNIAFVTEDEGSKVQMWAFNFVESNFTLLKEFNISDATQSEGCVYDDENLTLFISEEQDRGILRAYKINKKLEFNNPIIFSR
jgi:myo-inositol-hexaphosphate 3-phosphohydrolase